MASIVLKNGRSEQRLFGTVYAVCPHIHPELPHAIGRISSRFPAGFEQEIAVS